MSEAEIQADLQNPTPEGWHRLAQHLGPMHDGPQPSAEEVLEELHRIDKEAAKHEQRQREENAAEETLPPPTERG